jgi:hypothetical protein
VGGYAASSRHGRDPLRVNPERDTCGNDASGNSSRPDDRRGDPAPPAEQRRRAWQHPGSTIGACGPCSIWSIATAGSLLHWSCSLRTTLAEAMKRAGLLSAPAEDALEDSR